MINEQYTLGERTTAFSKNVLNFCKNEKLNIINRPIIDQLIKSVTSIGANYAEANNAAPKIDFRKKIFIAKKETAETKYWLTLMADTTSNPTQLRNLFKECHQFLMIFQKIISTMSHRKTKKA